MPAYIDVLVIAALALLVRHKPPLNSLLALISLVISLLVIECALVIQALPLVQHYREHEQFVETNQTYRGLVDATIDVPHGDLAGVSPRFPRDLYEPRRVRFRTDSWGYRNDADFRQQPWILLGDSFIVGNGLDQRDILPNQLRHAFAIDSYSLAHPGDPPDYERQALWFLDKLRRSAGRPAADPHFAVFFFEGNDFDSRRRSPQTTRERIGRLLNSYDNIRLRALRELPLKPSYPEVFYKLARRTEMLAFSREGLSVEVLPVANIDVGFLAHELAPPQEIVPTLDLALPAEVWQRVRCVFLIPSKARVYAEQLPEPYRTRLSTPSPALRVLNETIRPFGISAVDLTPSMRLRARELLSQGNLIYWRDDTHWNAAGIAATLPDVARCMRQKPKL